MRNATRAMRVMEPDRLPGSRETRVLRMRGAAERRRGLEGSSAVCRDVRGMRRDWDARSRLCRTAAVKARFRGPKSLDVEFPAGRQHWFANSIPGKGDAGRFGGPAGDLYVVTNVATHPFFKRMGDNIQCTVPITVSEAALGAKIEVPTIDGPCGCSDSAGNSERTDVSNARKRSAVAVESGIARRSVRRSEDCRAANRR